jgi:Phosphodiester glycosidase
MFENHRRERSREISQSPELILWCPDNPDMRRIIRPLLVVAALVAGLGAEPGGPVLATTSVRPAYHFCPGPEPLITAKTRWSHRRLAPGVSLAQTTVRDKAGRLDIRVVRADLARPSVHVAPLRGALTSRHRLSSLARRRHLVAATNAMYFDFASGAPVVPFISGRRPFVLSVDHQSVAGIGVDGRAEAGDVWLNGQITAAGSTQPLAAVNEVAPPPGLTLYTAAWGTHRVPVATGVVTRAIRHGRVLRHWTRPRHLPRHGRLLVATGAAAIAWLRSVPRGDHVEASMTVRTDAPETFRDAYGVGTQVVVVPGQIEHDLYCNRDEVRAARTTIAWRRHGSRLFLVTVESRKGSEHHGLDENQMSEILVQLGASQAFALDGGGSTELVTRRRGERRLTMSTVNPRGGQRPIPIGIGIYSR